MSSYKIEIACFNEASAIVAHKAGAHRIELCDDMQAGGITPNAEMFSRLRTQIDIPIYVMIRPRGGNFVYSEMELLEMQESIEQFDKLGADGFVFACLNEDSTFNTAQNKRLIAATNSKACSCHRAFDVHANFAQNLEDVIACGFSTILCSGIRGTAIDGLAQLKQIVSLAGNRISIMPGGGVRSSNLLQLRQALPSVLYFHSSAVDANGIADAEEIQRLLNTVI
jgi:copper homeostasis protein